MPGQFLGELNIISGLRVFVSAQVTKAGEVIETSREHLRAIMASDAALGDLLLGAFMDRRGVMLEAAAPSTLSISLSGAEGNGLEAAFVGVLLP